MPNGCGRNGAAAGGTECRGYGDAAKDVLIIAADELNTWFMLRSMYGGTVHTPNLDRLMGQGTTFESAQCQVAFCNPSRASIWTGDTATTTGIHNNAAGWEYYVDPHETLHATMKAAGYETVGIGKVNHHISVPADIRPVMIDSYVSAESYSVSAPLSRTDPEFTGLQEHHRRDRFPQSV